MILNIDWVKKDFESDLKQRGVDLRHYDNGYELKEEEQILPLGLDLMVQKFHINFVAYRLL